MNAQELQQMRRSIESFNEHEPRNIRKNSYLGKLLGVKRSIDFCESCEEEWPCRLFRIKAENMSDNLDSMIMEYEQLREAFDKIATMQAEYFIRIDRAKNILDGINETLYETESKFDDEVDTQP